jgi:hypothetical protein
VWLLQPLNVRLSAFAFSRPPAAVGVLAVWACLAVVVFTPFPVWLGHWADAWQQRAGMTAPRVPARGGMVAAAVAAWVVMATGLYLLLLGAAWILVWSSPATIWHQFPQQLRDMGFVITTSGSGQLGGWTVCLVIVAMPLAAAVAHRRRRRPGEAHDAAVPRRRTVTTVLLCLAGCLAAIALMLAVSAVTHARIAGPVRWSPDFLIRLVYFDEQAIVVVAVVCALIAAARARSARDVAISVVVGAAVAAAGVLALRVFHGGSRRRTARQRCHHAQWRRSGTGMRHVHGNKIERGHVITLVCGTDGGAFL